MTPGSILGTGNLPVSRQAHDRQVFCTVGFASQDQEYVDDDAENEAGYGDDEDDNVTGRILPRAHDDSVSAGTESDTGPSKMLQAPCPLPTPSHSQRRATPGTSRLKVSSECCCFVQISHHSFFLGFMSRRFGLTSSWCD